MRQIGTLPETALASRFASYLITEGISCEVEQEPEGVSIWVHDENQVEEARQRLAAFKQAPDAEQFRDKEQAARKIVRQDQERWAEAQRNMIDMRKNWAQPPGARTPLVVSMILLSIVVSLITGMGARVRPGSLSDQVTSRLMFVDHRAYAESKRDPLASLKRGEVWRLVTPVFIHLSGWHLAFNMFMFFQLGRLLELKLGPVRLGLLILAVAIISNLSQALTPPQLRELMGGPFFGGMSGVVYGLFGYAWVRSLVDPMAGYVIPPLTVFIMLGWLVLCMTPSVENVANTAHAAGLMCGMIAAQLPQR